LHPLFNSPIPTHWCGSRLWLVNDLKKSLSIQFCGSGSSIVSADVVHIKHSAWQHNVVFFCLCACQLPFCLFPRELICTCGACNISSSLPSHVVPHPIFSLLTDVSVIKWK
jgi:hypothetical protein